MAKNKYEKEIKKKKLNILQKDLKVNTVQSRRVYIVSCIIAIAILIIPIFIIASYFKDVDLIKKGFNSNYLQLNKSVNNSQRFLSVMKQTLSSNTWKNNINKLQKKHQSTIYGKEWTSKQKELNDNGIMIDSSVTKELHDKLKNEYSQTLQDIFVHNSIFFHTF